ncbi:MAG: PAS domain S-box protein [Giesbergeria sp.]|uniref:PAS domain S-box protein n=1 Tax=Giesbergeria sp. TaxID=2818473 RepID=UPI00261BB0BB|nr:PAS domain S-box protein [Giesbergeria sp.]MDD2608914.1 PAS domain S-box protein [Giesbergeria sp.]
MLDSFFLSGAERPVWLWPQHDPRLVALSVLLAVVASVMALHMATLAQRAQAGMARQVALFTSALALGGGIWGMHFIGMLAFSACARGQFDVLLTFVSILPGVLASWVALALLTRSELTGKLLLGGGVVVGAGIGTMHYVGMVASSVWPMMRYDPWGFALSMVLAVLLAVVGLWVRFGLQRHLAWNAWPLNGVAGSVMGLAIAAMHYTGMDALRFAGPVATDSPNGPTSQLLLALAIAVVTVFAGALVVAINVGLRFRQLFLEAQQSESRLRAVMDTAIDGIIMIDGRGTVQSYNSAAQRILGWSAEQVIGRNVHMLMPEPHHSAHDGYLQHHLRTGEERIIGTGREVQALHQDGSLVPIRLAVGRVQLPGPPLFVGFISDIRERRAIEASLRESEEKFRSLIDNIPGVTFRAQVDGQWRLLFISDAIEALTGWPAEDFLARRILLADLIPPAEWQQVQTRIGQALAQGQAFEAECRLRHRDGSLRWVSGTGRGVTDSQGRLQWIDGVLVDTTERHARNAEFESTVHAIWRSQAVVEFDLQGQVLTANANFLSLTGYTLEAIQGQHHRMFCTPSTVQDPSYGALWARLASGEFASGEFLRLGKHGREVWMYATYNPIFDAEGQPFKIVKIATDLSLRRAMEQEMRHAKERAEHAAAARSMFLANMSHEIRTPMNAIIGFTEALQDSALDAVQRRHLGTVHHAARSMLRLLNDILDTAKLEKGAVELELADFSLRELCGQILASLRITAQRKGLELRLDYPHTLPDVLHGDALRVQQILVNLLGNALKFTEQGQVTLRVAYHAGELLLEVQDTGIGIASDKLERIFDPFAQADASTTRRFGGTGLGTTISRQLSELMHGSISVQSTLGQGSCFTVRLPLPLGKAPITLPTLHSSNLRPLRILAVDDVADNLELLQLTLSRSNHQITPAYGGQQAVELFMQQAFDLVLMDLQMPCVDGLEATRRIRTFEQTQQRRPVPIIALSASVLEQDRRNALAAGMDGFADKPLDPQRLHLEMARVLDIRPVDNSNPTLVPIAPVAVALPPAVGPQAGPEPAIDWEKGLRLWTRLDVFSAALGRFMQEQQNTPETLIALLAQQDWTALRATAHRLRGAAGNLALTQVHNGAVQLELAAQQAHLPQMQTLVPALSAALAAAAQALQTVQTQAATASQDTLGLAPSVLSAAQQVQALQALEQLQTALAQAELPEAPLHTLAQLLHALSLEPLQQALDHFDFDRAQHCLERLRMQLQAATLQTSPIEKAP